MNRGVLLLGNHPPPFGGVPAHIADFAPYLAARGWNVHVAMIQPEQPRDLPELDRRMGYTIHRLTRLRILAAMARLDFLGPALREPDLLARAPARWSINVAVARLLGDILDRERLSLFSAYKLMSGGLYGAWLKHSRGTPYVTTIFGEVYREHARYLRDRRQVRRVVESCDKMVSCSRHCAQSLARLHIDADVEPVIYGIDTNAFRPDLDGGPIRDRLGIPANVQVVLFVARMVREMGLGTLLEAGPAILARNPDSAILIAGQRGELTSAAQEFCASNSGRAFVFPDVPGPELPLCYAAASIVVVPSINERACLGLAIAEGMSSGKPVVAARVGGHGEVATDGETGLLVPPADPGALAAALNLLLQDRDLRSRMGQRGRERAVAALDKSLTNARMEAIFVDVLERHACVRG